MKNNGPYLIDGKAYESKSEWIETNTPYTYSQWIKFLGVTGFAGETKENLEEFAKWIEEQKKERKVNYLVEIFYDGIKHRSLKQLFRHLDVTAAQYVAYRKATGNQIRKTEDVQGFLDYLAVDNRTRDAKKNDGKLGSGNRSQVTINGETFSSITEYVTTKTPYTVKDYNYFKQKTGISISSTETAEQFSEWTNTIKKKSLKSTPLEYNGNKYNSKAKLLVAIGSTDHVLSLFQKETGKALSSQEELEELLQYIKERNKKKNKKKKNTNEFSYVKLVSNSLLEICKQLDLTKDIEELLVNERNIELNEHYLKTLKMIREVKGNLENIHEPSRLVSELKKDAIAYLIELESSIKNPYINIEENNVSRKSVFQKVEKDIEKIKAAILLT